MRRKSEYARKTKETDVRVTVDLDGSGKYELDTGIPFFDHMLSLMFRHGRMDVGIKASGDLQVDYHHTVEDIGITLGKAIAQALGDKAGINRYGQACVPMDEALSEVAIDISGRPFLVMNLSAPSERVGSFDRELAQQFFQALAVNAGLTVHINLRYGSNLHHILEAVFKAFGRAFHEAARIDALTGEIPSTKGTL